MLVPNLRRIGRHIRVLTKLETKMTIRIWIRSIAILRSRSAANEDTALYISNFVFLDEKLQDTEGPLTARPSPTRYYRHFFKKVIVVHQSVFQVAMKLTNMFFYAMIWINALQEAFSPWFLITIFRTCYCLLPTSVNLTYLQKST
jgi:hypothetical protein